MFIGLTSLPLIIANSNYIKKPDVVAILIEQTTGLRQYAKIFAEIISSNRVCYFNICDFVIAYYRKLDVSG